MKVTCGIYLFNNENRLLIGHPTKHAWFTWSIPKGRVDEVEIDHYEVAKRELLEETNIDINKIKDKIVASFEFDLLRYRATNKYLKSYYIKCNYDFTNEDIKCDSMVIHNGIAVFPEIDAFKWVTIEEAKELLHESQTLNLEMCQKLL